MSVFQIILVSIVLIPSIVIIALTFIKKDNSKNDEQGTTEKHVYTNNHSHIIQEKNVQFFKAIPEIKLNEREQEKYFDFLLNISDIIYTFLKNDFPCLTENKYLLFDSILFCNEIVKFKFCKIKYDFYMHGLELSDIKKIALRNIYLFENYEKDEGEESFVLYEEFITISNKRENELSTLFQECIANDILNIKPIIGKFSSLCLNESSLNDYANINDSLIAFSAEKMFYYSSKARDLFDYVDLICDKYPKYYKEHQYRL